MTASVVPTGALWRKVTSGPPVIALVRVPCAVDAQPVMIRAVPSKRIRGLRINGLRSDCGTSMP
ncbi:hypothetical protein GCM10007854_04010 [Algimonas porphyrae]|uniref:Uncharacterized protein n=1 Tax=Algimonas porphyrae TaxID=1128113 RepID=A0ABQ5UYJ2_9PROT|nr:hypothetical protein GCM10007854_04010 [Algimonas porphyrae]